MAKQLEKPKNFRRTKPKCCASCKFFLILETEYAAVWGCARDTTWSFTDESMYIELHNNEQYDYVCDRYEAQS